MVDRRDTRMEKLQSAALHRTAEAIASQGVEHQYGRQVQGVDKTLRVTSVTPPVTWAR